MSLMNFGQAISELKQGKQVARKDWNGKGIFIELQVPDANSKMTHPYIFIDTTGLQTNNPDAPKDRIPWLASQTDMLSEDWIIREIPCCPSPMTAPVQPCSMGATEECAPDIKPSCSTNTCSL